MPAKKRGLLEKARRFVELELRRLRAPKLNEKDFRLESREESSEDLVEIPSDVSDVSSVVKKLSKHKAVQAEIGLGSGRVVPGRCKKSSEEPVLTGMPGIDQLTGGGFAKGSVNVVCGSPGSGKTAFGLQFLFHGIKTGENALFVSFEAEKEGISALAEKSGFSLEELEQRREFSFIRYKPEDIQQLLGKESNALKEAVSWAGAKRVFVDSLTSLVLLFKNELAAKEAVLWLIETLKAQGVTSLLSAEQQFELDRFSGVLLPVDCCVSLLSLRHENIRHRVAQVGDSVLPLRFADSGIVILPTE